MAPPKDTLPQTIRPGHYVVDITPDFVTFKYSGSVKISVKILQSTEKIILNTLDIKIVECYALIGADSAKRVNCKSHSYDEKLQWTTFEMDSALPANTDATIVIAFSAIHGDSMSGFYRSSYKPPGSTEKKFMLVTQFEPTAARQAFPCWDEPKYKTTFDLTLNVPKSMVALSNMPVESQKPLDGDKKDLVLYKFQKSPAMPTYLLAFAVGEFEYIEAHTPENSDSNLKRTPVRVYTTHGLSEHGKFALNCAVKFLEYYSRLFKIPYVLPKMDMLAVPDFSAGAMENWGLVTYRTSALLYYENQSSSHARQQIAYIVAHELAHQWFGNLVTMYDWSELWLNEGFATWVGWFAVDNEFPSWSVWTQFIESEMARALELDGLRSSHPIVVPVNYASDISQIFDAISYSKGACIIRMLVEWLTPTAFFAGVAAYLQKFRYANATSTDLWNALKTASGKNVEVFINNWIMCTGYPALSISVDKEKNTLKASQCRFLSQCVDKKSTDAHADDGDVVWHCPLGIPTSVCPEAAKLILTEKSKEFPIDSKVLDKIRMSKINMGQPNLYRVKYEPDALAEIVKDEKLKSEDLAGLVNDAFALSVSGQQSTTVALDLCLALREHLLEYVMWSQIGSAISSIFQILSTQPKALGAKDDALSLECRQIRKLCGSLFKPIVDKLGWEAGKSSAGDDGREYQNTLLRTLAIGMCSWAEVPEVTKHALMLFNQRDKTPISPNIRNAVYAAAIRSEEIGTRTNYDSILAIYENNALAEDDRLTALSALGCSRDPERLKELLEYTVSENLTDCKVRPQDWIYPIRSICRNPVGRLLGWHYVRGKWSLLERVFRVSLSTMSRFVTLTENISTEDELKTEVEDFFKDKDTKLFDKGLSQDIEKIRGNISLVKRDGEAIRTWLAANAPSVE